MFQSSRAVLVSVLYWVAAVNPTLLAPFMLAQQDELPRSRVSESTAPEDQLPQVTASKNPLLSQWERVIREKITKDRNFQALIRDFPLSVLESRRFAKDPGGYG